MGLGATKVEVFTDGKVSVGGEAISPPPAGTADLASSAGTGVG